MNGRDPVGLLCQVGGFRVDLATVRAPSFTMALDDVAGVRLRRPLLVATWAVATALLTLAWTLRRYLYPSESVVIVGLALLSLLVGFAYGTLTIISRHFREAHPVHGYAPTLRKVRDAIDRALTGKR